MEEITFKDLVCAYRKLKAMSYHDNSDLYLRWKISKFESDEGLKSFEDPIDRLREIFDHLVIESTKKRNAYWSKKFEGIDYYALPKEVKSFVEYEDAENSRNENDRLIKNIFTNIREVDKDDSYDIKKLTLFFDAPIEIYILSILWIMKLGYKLDIKLDDKCFGNRLLLKEDLSGQKNLVNDEGLFKPYYKQYQRWRDEGISTAKHYLDKGENVLFINLDIKNYYYSVRILKESVDEELGLDSEKSSEYINELFWNFHDIYTAKIRKIKYPQELIFKNKNENILPIGLPSSYVLANWYLKNFDINVNEFINPVYYSRYVDDIFIVTANNDMSFDFIERMKEEEVDLMKSMSQLSSNEKYIIGLLSPVLKLEAYNTEDDNIKIKEVVGDGIGSSEYRFIVKNYDQLYIQAAKTLVYFFDPESSLALLDKFKNELEKRSSEFRFLPDDELNKSGFDDEAYELVFEDSQHKIKTLKDYKENRYGIASHLSKKIFYTLRNGNKGTDEDASKIVKFFNGTNNLEHYRQWERLMTYLVINDKRKLLNSYIAYTLQQLERIDLSNDTRKSKVKLKQVKFALTQQFLLSLNLSLALVPDIALSSNVVKIIQASQTPDSLLDSSNLKVVVTLEMRKVFRWANMIRHSYVTTPLANFLIGMDNLALTGFGLDQLPGSSGGGFDPNKIAYSPRKVRFCEVAWMQCILRVRQATQANSAHSDDLLYGNTTYLHEAFEHYYRINYWYDVEGTIKETLRKEIFEYEHVADYNLPGSKPVKVHEISVNPKGGNKFDEKKLKNLVVGLANMKVEKQNYEAAMLGRPNLEGRYKDFAKILNMAEQEDCNLLVLPELALPPALVKTFLDNSWSHQRCIITGIEHWTGNNVAYNFVLNILPCYIRGVRDAVPVLRLKNHYSPEENFWVENYRRIAPKPDPFRYHLFRWRGLYFGLYYCFELADVFHRSIFKSKVDFLVASEWNPDTNYFSNIAEVSSRDLHCYFIQVNTNQYGDSRIIRPSKTESKDILQIKGGKNIALLTSELEIETLRYFQYKGYGLQKEDKTFKPTPADFNPDDVLIRQENKSFAQNQGG